MGYQPKHQKQLDGSATAGEDCGVRSVMMALDFATRGAAMPSKSAMRDRMGVPSGSTNTADQERGVESFDKPGETGGRQPVQYERKVGAPWDTFTGPLDNAEKAVVLSLDYGVVNEQRPGLSGDPNFDGNHSVMFLGSRVNGSNGNREYKAWDSLYDGRRAEIPHGPQWWPGWLARDAAAAFAGAQGKATGGIIPTAWLIEDEPEPEPEPDTEAEARGALMEERAWLAESIPAMEARIARIDAIYPPNTAAAEAVVVAGTSAE